MRKGYQGSRLNFSIGLKKSPKIFYNTKTNEFAVLSKDGLIRTFFKPTTGMVYFMDSEDPYEEIQMPML